LTFRPYAHRPSASSRRQLASVPSNACGHLSLHRYLLRTPPPPPAMSSSLLTSIA
jgi:hypothetical protein